MNIATVTTGTTTHTTTINNKTYKIEMVDDSQLSMASDDDDDDIISSEGSMYGDGDMVQMSIQDDVANQLAAAGPVGVAAAAAIASSKKRRRPHSFETNPSVRKRQQNRLLRKLRGIIYEFTGRVGKQAVVLVATPGKPNTSYKVFGAKPLEDVVRNLKNIVMDELENALAQQAPPPPQDDPSLFELPPLIIDGIPTPVEKMTQAQLRAFIPLMLKYSTGRGKPGWGRESTRPPWWPKELPWANVRMDARSEDDKQKISWTHALRKIVINCYKYHGREDLLPTFADEEDKVNQIVNQAAMDSGSAQMMPTVVTTTANTNSNHQQVNVVKINANGTVITTQNATAQTSSVPTIIQNTNNHHVTTTATLPASTKIEIHTVPHQQHHQHQSQHQQNNTTSAQNLANAQYTQTVLSTIQNADGTVSLIQVDPNNPIITLPDGTTAQVQGVATLHQGEGGATIQTVQSLSDINGHENMTMDLTEATVAQDGQIYITAEDGQGYPVSVSNMITVPVSASMYQSMMANIQQLHTNSEGQLCITPMQVDSNSQNSSSQSNNNNNNNTSNNSSNHNNNINNSSNNNNNHYQCYSIVAAPAAAAGQRLINNSQLMPPTTTVSNVANTRCQIFNASLNNNSNSSQQQNQLQTTAKVYLTSNLNQNQNNLNLVTNTTNINNNNNSITTNNNNNNLRNNKNATTVAPLVVIAGNTPKGGNKRRKQALAKVVPIKLEANATTQGLLNIQIVDGSALPTKAIKVETVEN